MGLGIITRSSLLRMQHTKFEAEKYVMTKENWSKAATEKRIKKQPKLNWKLNSLAFTCSQQSASATAKSLRIFHWKFFFPLCIMNMWSNKRQTEIGAIYRISFICELIHWIVEVCECLEKSISAFIVTFYSMHFFPFIIAIIILRLEQQIHRNISFSFVSFCSFFVLFGFFVHFFRSSYIFLFSRTYYFSFAQFFFSLPFWHSIQYMGLNACWWMRLLRYTYITYFEKNRNQRNKRRRTQTRRRQNKLRMRNRKRSNRVRVQHTMK